MRGLLPHVQLPGLRKAAVDQLAGAQHAPAKSREDHEEVGEPPICDGVHGDELPDAAHHEACSCGAHLTTVLYAAWTFNLGISPQSYR